MQDGKRDNKTKKKITRCLAILQKDFPSIKSSEKPTKFLFIGNAGLTTNADESLLVKLVTSFGPRVEVDAVIMIPGKQYSFAVLASEDQSQQVQEAAHGKMSVEGSTSPVYMAYVDQVPSGVSSHQEYGLPPGLTLVEDFISKEEENMLLNLIPWEEKPSEKAEGSVLKHRQVRHFGYEFKYSSNSVDKDNPLPMGLPPSISNIAEKIVKEGWMKAVPDQMTVNKYLPGHGIPPHVDTHSSFTDEILSLSTGGAVIMDFRNAASGETEDSQKHFKVYLPPRSLCVMTGPARYEWTHGICPRMTDVVPGKGEGAGLQLHNRQERISFTFRKIREGECHCNNLRVCDSAKRAAEDKVEQEASALKSLDSFSAMKLEQENVLQVYDQIASHFSMTRHKPWPQVLEFVTSLPPGSIMLDVGCGNGKYLGHNEKIMQIGCDTSFELTKICKTRRFEVLTCNCLQLPYRESTFDALICIAVIHHLASEERRLSSIKEMARVLKIGGRGLIYVWALEQQQGKRKSAYLKQNKNNRKDNRGSDQEGSHCSHGSCSGKMEVNMSANETLPVHVNRTEFAQQDMFVPWKLKPQMKKSISEKGKQKKNGCFDKLSCSNVPVTGCDQTPKAPVIDEGKSDCTIDNSGDSKSSNDEAPVYKRFYHVFKQGELESLCTTIEGLAIVKSYYDEGNWCVILEKRSD